MKVSDLNRDRKELAVDLGEGDVINIVYNPRAYTIEVEELIEEKAGEQFKAGTLLIMLEPMLLDWDVMVEEPGDFPPNVENLKKVPIDTLGKIIEAIGDAARPSSEEGKDSGGTSP